MTPPRVQRLCQRCEVSNLAAGYLRSLLDNSLVRLLEQLTKPPTYCRARNLHFSFLIARKSIGHDARVLPGAGASNPRGTSWKPCEQFTQCGQVTTDIEMIDALEHLEGEWALVRAQGFQSWLQRFTRE